MPDFPRTALPQGGREQTEFAARADSTSPEYALAIAGTAYLVARCAIWTRRHVGAHPLRCKSDPRPATAGSCAQMQDGPVP